MIHTHNMVMKRVLVGLVRGSIFSEASKQVDSSFQVHSRAGHMEQRQKAESQDADLHSKHTRRGSSDKMHRPSTTQAFSVLTTQ